MEVKVTLFFVIAGIPGRHELAQSGLESGDAGARFQLDESGHRIQRVKDEFGGVEPAAGRGPEEIVMKGRFLRHVADDTGDGQVDAILIDIL